jgi:tRNA uridine 5-carboxymethylaminomethyl modification enzyme
VSALLDAAGSAPITQPVRIVELARRQGIALETLFSVAGVGATLPREAVVTAELEIKYEGYFERERVQADRMRRMGELTLAEDLPYAAMQSLTYEARQKLLALRPASLAQASRIPGVSPSDLQNLVVEVERVRRAGSGVAGAARPREE